MSIEATLEQVSAIRRAMADPSILIGAGGPPTGGTEAPGGAGTAATGESSFARELQLASGGAATTGAGTPGAGSSASGVLDGAGASTPGMAEVSDPGYVSGAQGVYGGLQGVSGATVPGAAGSGPGAQIVAVAEGQIGQSEQPPGSNEGPAIAQYRSATAGAAPGEPWCAYFASWAARQAGEPIGTQGQGLGSVSEIWSWAQSAGRAVANGPGVVPKPGDLIVFGDEHVGIVRGVLPSGQIETIEGNYENKVSANVRSASEATGYVSMS
jgi:CHAP domain